MSADTKLFPALTRVTKGVETLESQLPNRDGSIRCVATHCFALRIQDLLEFHPTLVDASQQIEQRALECQMRRALTKQPSTHRDRNGTALGSTSKINVKLLSYRCIEAALRYRHVIGAVCFSLVCGTSDKLSRGST